MLQLPDPRLGLTWTPDAAAREVFHSFSKGMCPVCRELVDGARVIREGKVYLRKQCPRHGRQEALISGDAEWFLRMFGFVRPGSVPLKHSRPVLEGCPRDRGLCTDHEQHTCLPIIEITNHCNLECPICIVQNRNNYHMTREEFALVIDGLVEKEGTLETITDPFAEVDRFVGHEHLQVGDDLDHASEPFSRAPSTNRHTVSTNPWSGVAVTTVSVPAALSRMRRQPALPRGTSRTVGERMPPATPTLRGGSSTNALPLGANVACWRAVLRRDPMRDDRPGVPSPPRRRLARRSPGATPRASRTCLNRDGLSRRWRQIVLDE